ncbi:MAG: hypothetical protein J6W84_06265 [Bacteroidales bacterium]|nr:hypothetical protein [Bacteroidales bacterium]
MFLRIVFPDKTWRELAVPADGSVELPLWALQFRLLDVGITSGDIYATLPMKIAVKGSIKAICGEDQIEIPEQSTIDQLIALVNDLNMSAQEIRNNAATAAQKAGEASDSAAAALRYEQLALQHKNDAESAKTAAETAEGLASSAKTASETAQGRAEAAQTASETAQGKAEDAQTAAETAQGKAEDAQGIAEEAAQNAQSYAESLDSAAIHAAIEEKGDNLWFNEEEGKLYLMSGDTPIGDGVTVITHGGGGGGGETSEYAITLTNLLPSRMFSVSENAEVELQFSYSSVDSDEYDDGNGIGSIIVNNVVKATLSIPQGNNAINVTPYLAQGTNTVKVKVTNSESNSRTLTYQINVITLSVSTTFDELGIYNGDVVFNYTPSGTGVKTIHFEMDGVEIDTETVSSNNRSQSFTIPEQNHGAHIFRCWATMIVDEISVMSNVITLGMMWIDPQSNTTIVLCPFSTTTARQGETLAIPFMVYDPDTENATITREVLYSDDSVYAHTEVTVDRTAQVWNVSDYPSGTVKFVLSCGAVSVTKEVTVSESTIIIEPVTDALQLEFSAAGRSNNEQNPASWSNHGYSATFEGFGWTGADGWVDDANGKTALRFLPNDFMTIPFKAFADDARTSGLTIEAEFATRDVQDYDSVVISCLESGRGFKIASQNAALTSEQSSVSMQFKEDSHVRVCFAVENRNQNRLVYIYVDGVMCGVTQYPANDNFAQADPVGLTIGAESCGIDLYSIRIYGKGLNSAEQLDNYIYDQATLAQREAAYHRNDIFNANEEVSFEKLPPTLPYMIFDCPELPQYKGDKKTGINVTYVDPANAANSFTATGVEMDVQGTSSAGYPVKNFKPKFKQGFHMTQSGTTESKFKLRSTSIPVSTFCLKADFASSENANNVKLVDCYEQNCPYHTPPQQEDDRVRQGIDGIPIVVFWKDSNNDVHFVGKYNFNNDKSTANVFGFTADYPNAESWEFKNNTSNRCLLKVSDYTGNWLDDFEARYPEDNESYTQLKRVTDWIVSTDRDAVQDAEDKAARLAKFTSEFEDYFVKSATLFYYLFTEVFLMIDSRAKNMFLTTYDGTHWLPLPYDFDTALGINNEGVLSFDYDLEDTDTVGGANVFNGQTSVLWRNVRDAFGSDLKSMYQTLRSGGTFSYSVLKQMFDAHQSVWPEAIWNEDAFVKYLKPYLIDGENYLSMLQGSKESQRDWWLYNAFKYRDSKYHAGDALNNYITLRCYALGDITVTPYSNIYPTIKYGSYTVTTRGKRNTAYTLVNPMDAMNDTEVYIYSADRIKSVGDLSGLQVGYANFAAATKLQSLKLGDSDANYENTNLKELYVGNNELLKTIDLRNCSALGTDTQKSVDFSGCASLEKVYAQGTALGGIELPNGGHVDELHYPSTLTNLTILNQKNLTTLTYEGLTSLTTLHIENTPNVDIEDIVNDAVALNRVRLIGVEWTATSALTLESTIDKLKACIGMDALGNNTAKAVVTGSVDVSEITEELLLDINENFPELEVVSGGVPIHVVSFYNDNTLLDTQVVQHGSDATAPSTNPTKEQTAQYTYTFSGWSGSLTNVTENRRLYAQFTQTVRTYTVYFYNGSTLLQTVNNVPYGGTATYTGETPVDPQGGDFLTFQPTGANITGTTNCYAQFTAVYEYAEITDSWQDILDAIDNGTYKAKYKVGNYKPIDFGSRGILNMQIVAFDADDLANGDGTAPITWISDNLMFHHMNPDISTDEQGYRIEGTGAIGGWNKCAMRSYLKETIKPLILQNVRNRIVEVTKSSVGYDTTGEIVLNELTSDDVWIPSAREIFGAEFGAETVGTVYNKVFNNSNLGSRIKKGANNNTAYMWWLRSARHQSRFASVSDSGGYASGSSSTTQPSRSNGVALGFCLGASNN